MNATSIGLQEVKIEVGKEEKKGKREVLRNTSQLATYDTWEWMKDKSLIIRRSNAIRNVLIITVYLQTYNKGIKS